MLFLTCQRPSAPCMRSDTAVRRQRSGSRFPESNGNTAANSRFISSSLLLQCPLPSSAASLSRTVRGVRRRAWHPPVIEHRPVIYGLRSLWRHFGMSRRRRVGRANREPPDGSAIGGRFLPLSSAAGIEHDAGGSQGFGPGGPRTARLCDPKSCRTTRVFPLFRFDGVGFG